MIVLALAAVNLPPCARWSLPLFAMPACIFHPISPPASLSRRWRRRIWHRVPAGHCRCSPHRRAFFIPYPRRHDRFGAGGGEFGTVCPPAAAVARLTGVHFSFSIPAGMIVLALPAGIWHRVPAGRCRCSPCRRAFFVLYPRRYGRLAAGSEEFTTVCPPAVAVVRHAGVHFLSRIPAGMVVFALAAENLAPCARWSLPLFAMPACIFRFVSPPVAVVARLTGVHFSSYFPASLFVSPLPAVNLSSAGPLPFLISAACKKGAAGKSIALHRGCPKSHEMT